MTNSKTTKKALLSSALALTMCVAMLIATTFAWFTDTASTSVNKIQAGKLDVALYYADNATGVDVTTWTKIDDNSAALGWLQKTSAEGKVTMVTNENKPLWEPGCTFSLPALKIVNEGDLALKYKIVISGITGNAKLLDAIDWTMKLDGEAEILGTEHNLLAKTDEKESKNIFTISGHMKEEAGNEYQGLSIDGIAITVYATQLASEFDSTTDQYDKDALYDLKINESATGNLPVTTNSTTTEAIVETATTISSGSVSVEYPVDVKLSTDAASTVTGTTGKKATVEQKLEYKGAELSETATENKISINANTQAAASYNLTLPVADTNAVLIPITIKYQKGLTGVMVYHSGVALGTSANEGKTNGEYFTYNGDDGILVLYLKHASPIDVVFDKPGVTSFNMPEGDKVIITGGVEDTDYAWTDYDQYPSLGTTKRLMIKTSRALEITTTGTEESPTNMYIDINTTSANITLAGAVFSPGYTCTRGINVRNGASLALNLKSGTQNYVCGTDEVGIAVPTGASLTINGTGTLDVYSGKNGGMVPAIGETASKTGWGTITISGGIVNATSQIGGAGIGGATGGGSDYCDGTIVINGGTVTAKSIKCAGYQGASIGAGQKSGSGLDVKIYCSGGDITINGGTVYAETIGGAAGTDKGNITIGKNATILGLDGKSDSVTIGSGTGSKVAAAEGKAKNTVTDNRIK